MKELYTYVFRSVFSEVLRFNDGRLRLLCYDITILREKEIMETLSGVLTQTNSVEVGEEDPLLGMSWFSGDFSEEDLPTVLQWLEDTTHD